MSDQNDFRRYTLVELYYYVHRERWANKSAVAHYRKGYEALLAELEADGYWIEHGYGIYLHCPDGDTLTLDYWNDDD